MALFFPWSSSIQLVLINWTVKNTAIQFQTVCALLTTLTTELWALPWKLNKGFDRWVENMGAVGTEEGVGSDWFLCSTAVEALGTGVEMNLWANKRDFGRPWWQLTVPLPLTSVLSTVLGYGHFVSFQWSKMKLGWFDFLLPHYFDLNHNYNQQARNIDLNNWFLVFALFISFLEERFILIGMNMPAC